jgi:transcriptional regulator GlxA family with amidase domain
VIGHLLRRRATRAQHLLLTTNLPVKVIAAEVGVPDLQEFNKLIRRHCGHSPRAVRELSRRGA